MSIIADHGTHANAINANNREEIEKLKAAVSFTALLRKDGVKCASSGTQARCLCPFHHESTPSFTVYDDQRGHCFGCGWSGDVIEYLKKRFETDFPTAKVLLEDLVETGELRMKAKVKPVVVEPSILPAALTEIQRLEAQRMAALLHGSPKLCRQIAESRGWKTETIVNLAASGELGWHNNSVAFLYDTGIKLRPWAWDRENIRWYCGKPYLWRASTMRDALDIIIAEGETDALSLVDAGKSTGGRTVIAAPSATTFNPAWAPAFAGKIVTLCFDNDEAGQKGAQKVAGYLAPFAAEIFTIDWKEISHV